MSSGSGISVAMATYNGAAYVEAQLRSILAQTLLPDEIVVVDDASRDDTRQIVERVCASAAVPIRLVAAEKNQGSNATFERAIGLCAGEWIALADQDDVWVETKLARLKALAQQHGWDAVFSDAALVDKALCELGVSLLDNSRCTARMRRDFARGDGLSPLLRYNVVTGCTLMFRAERRALVLPLDRGWVHDYWIALLIACVGRIGLCEEPLVLYRQHGLNQIGARKGFSNEASSALRKQADAYRIEAEDMVRLRERLGSAKPAAMHLRCKETYLRRRCATYSGVKSGLKAMLLNMREGAHFRYGRGARALAKDLLMPFSPR